jgi:hypothetical protein
MFKINWHQMGFDMDIGDSVNLLKWIVKYRGGGGQDSNLELYNQEVKVGEGWLDLEPLFLTIF